jgi:hypothetical protein
MFKRKWTGFLIVALAGAAAMAANAQQVRPAGASDLSVIGKQMSRSEVLQGMALDDQTLNLSAQQAAEINRLTESFIEERRKLDEKFPPTRGEMPKADSIIARQQALVVYNTAVSRLLTAEQTRAWQEARAARRPAPYPADRPFGLDAPAGKAR